MNQNVHNSSPNWDNLSTCPIADRIRKKLLLSIPSDGILDPAELAKRGCRLHYPEDRPKRQRGGESLAYATLESFFKTRGEGYSNGISSPSKSWSSCSRLRYLICMNVDTYLYFHIYF